MSSFIKWLNFYRNVKGRLDLMLFFFKWDSDYRKDLTTTLLAFALFGYSVVSWNTFYDLIAMAVEAAIIMVQVGGEMSIMPSDYRPSHGGVTYSAQHSTHIANDELSFPMSAVLPAPSEAALGFGNPVDDIKTCKESPLVSSKVDDILMTRKNIPWREEKEPINFITSRHQLRYIAIRVLNKLTHTTNGVLLAFHDMADSLAGDGPVTLRKAFYYDALLTVEAFRSRIFRGNLQNEKEVYTDLTTYFPVKRETFDGQECLRFTPDFYKHVSLHMGITSLLLTENKRVAMLLQGSTNAVGASMVCLGGSGSFNYADVKKSGHPEDFRDMAAYAMAREVCEETGIGNKWLKEVRKNTMVTGFFRWIDRCGLPEFIGITRAGKIPFSKMQAIDGDEVVRFDEVPIIVNKPEDFHQVLAYIHDKKIVVALSSLMALHRMTVIAGYGAGFATPEQKEIYRKVSEFLAA
ncbi:MAG: hypothetical protein K8R48_08230 [Alphaproteobacteria bacterium]|nr:hypothetical protein [Alphaproteobacteria bacterium]